MTELKTCPFCGGEADVVEVPSKFVHGSVFFVTCDSQSCPGYHAAPRRWNTKAEAERAWNSRPEPRVVWEWQVDDGLLLDTVAIRPLLKLAAACLKDPAASLPGGKRYTVRILEGE